MSLIKRVKGDYNIHTLDPANNVLIETNTLTVDGNLIVTGTTTEVESTNTTITDNIIVLNNGGFISPNTTSGIEIDRGGVLDNVQLRFNEDTNEWEATDDGSLYYPLHPPAIVTFDLVDDLTPQLGGDLDVNGFAITSAIGSDGDVEITADGAGNVRIERPLTIPIRTTNATPLIGYNKIYAKDVESGGSGIYFTHADSTQDELVSKTKAIVFSLIF